MERKNTLVKNYFFSPADVLELGTEICSVMTQVDGLLQEASGIIGEISALAESVPSKVRYGVLQDECAVAQREIGSVDFLAYGQRVNNGLLKLADYNDYISNKFIKAMQDNSERVQGFASGCRSLSALLAYEGGEGVFPDMKYVQGIKLAESNVTEIEEETLTREEILQLAAKKMSGANLDANGRPIVNNAEAGKKACAYYRYLDDMKSGVYSNSEIAAIVAGISINNGVPSINSKTDAINYANYFFGLQVQELTYSDEIVEFIRQKESPSLTVYNNGKTIGYGFDIEQHSNIEVNYEEDGSITKEEAERLLLVVLDEDAEALDDFLEEEGLEINSNTYDACIDLVYNRGLNPMTKEIIKAMAYKDDEEVKRLFGDFDYRFAYYILYGGTDENTSENIVIAEKAKAYVDRNPGLEIRRNEEYNIYKYGFDENGDVIYED